MPGAGHAGITISLRSSHLLYLLTLKANITAVESQAEKITPVELCPWALWPRLGPYQSTWWLCFLCSLKSGDCHSPLKTYFFVVLNLGQFSFQAELQVGNVLICSKRMFLISPPWAILVFTEIPAYAMPILFRAFIISLLQFHILMV